MYRLVAVTTNDKEPPQIKNNTLVLQDIQVRVEKKRGSFIFRTRTKLSHFAELNSTLLSLGNGRVEPETTIAKLVGFSLVVLEVYGGRLLILWKDGFFGLCLALSSEHHLNSGLIREYRSVLKEYAGYGVVPFKMLKLVNNLPEE